MLLTATTASIGYILTQIKEEHWSSLIYFPMAALALLSASFICGLLYCTIKLRDMILIVDI